MKKVMLVLLFVVTAMSLATAANTIPTINNLTQDILGAHLVYGRGCIACHAPHSGPAGNDGTGVATSTGAIALWGQDLTPMYGQVINFSGDGKATYQVTLPANQAAVNTLGAHDPTAIILFCLSCHDGNLAKPGMMKGTTVETLPVVGGNAPTFLGNDGSGAANYGNDHPVGINAAFSCTGQYNWDCTISATGKVSMTGPNSSQFMNNYGFAVSLPVINGTTISERDAASQAMCPGNSSTSRTTMVRLSAAAVPHTPFPKAMRTQAGFPWKGPTTNSPPFRK